VHLVITDSGLGGLSVCAGLERALRASGPAADLHLSYVNAWPDQGHGYNDLPDMAARAAAFDRALQAIAALHPDRLVIACNTLSIVFEHTAFRRTATVPVHGIVDAGVDLYHEALIAHPGSALVLLGTRTTIETGVHRERLLQRGIAPERVRGSSCHGLATAIERGPDSPRATALLESCAEQAGRAAPEGDPLYVGLSCTHYGMVADRLLAALSRHARRGVVSLDPNARLVREIVRIVMPGQPGTGGAGRLTVDAISKVEVTASQRVGIARLLEAVSPATAEALRACRHVPDLF
jgi:glutamate racemase